MDIPHFFSHSSNSGHLTCLHPLTFVNNGAVNMGEQISLWDSALTSVEYVHKSRTARSYGNFIFSFLKNCYTVFHSGYSILHLHQQCTKIPISPQLYQNLLFFFFLVAILMVWSSISLWFWCAFLYWLVMWSHSSLFLGATSLQILCVFWTGLLVCYWVAGILYTFWIIISCQTYNLQLFSPTV